jgi:hypothetical protein
MEEKKEAPLPKDQLSQLLTTCKKIYRAKFVGMNIRDEKGKKQQSSSPNIEYRSKPKSDDA